MSGSRDRVRMDDAEVTALLEENLKVQVASLGADGAPHLSTLFYALRDGRVAFWTYGRSQKALNLGRDARLSALVEDGVDYGELRGVSITGRAELLTDTDVVAEVGRDVGARMAGARDFATLEADDADTAALVRGAVDAQAAKRVAVVVHADRVASWDHRKLHGG